jgi:hypothetical protein
MLGISDTGMRKRMTRNDFVSVFKLSLNFNFNFNNLLAAVFESLIFQNQVIEASELIEMKTITIKRATDRQIEQKWVSLI